MFFRNVDGFRHFSILQPDEVTPRSAGRIEASMNGRQLDVPFRGERGAKRLRKIGHQLEIIEPAMINGLVNLRGTKRGPDGFGNLMPFPVEKRFHWVRPDPSP